MRVISRNSGALLLLATLALPMSAQAQGNTDSSIIVNGARLSGMPKGPEIKGIITARTDDAIQITLPDGSRQTVAIDNATQIRGGSGLLGGNRNRPTVASLLRGLPVTVKTWQAPGGLIADRISFKGGDLKTAMMIDRGTSQRFEEQSAATAALRGRMGDIDKYNIKATTNVYFDTGKAVLSERAKADLCSAANTAEGMDNALLLVVGYTDSTGSQEVNQALSERRAGSVINFLQQACRWKPYRMLTPTGMASADPVADNTTPQGKAQNRRVSVNVLVSKGLDGM